MGAADGMERLARSRLRSLRVSLGLSLAEVGGRAHLSASTVSRIETGHRALSLDVLVPLANALQVSLDALLTAPDDDDVVIRPVPQKVDGHTMWPLSRPDGHTVAVKMRLEPDAAYPPQRVHPGHDWFVVVLGRVRLWLGERTIDVEQGEAAEFSTMTPHALSAPTGPAEVVLVFDRDGQRAHVHHTD